MNEFRKLEFYFQAGLYTMLVIPFLMIVFGGGITVLIAAPFTVFLALSWFVHRRGWPSKRHTTWWNVAVLAFIGLTGLQLVFTETLVLDAALRLVLVLILIKLFSRLAERDDLQVMALSLLLLAAATTVNEDLTFGILFGLYVLAGTLTLAVFHLRSELLPRQRMLLGRKVPINRQYMGVLAILSVGILATSVAIFFLFPRIGFGFFVQQSRDGVHMTGLSDEVSLGQHGAIRDNPKVVMRVEFPDTWDRDFSGLHWRAMTFDHYDGKQWSRTLDAKEKHFFSRRGVYKTQFFHPNDPGRDDQEVSVYLEPLGTNILPVLWPTEKVKLGMGNWVDRFGPKSGSVTYDRYGDMRHTYESEVGIPYVLSVGALPKPGAEDYGERSRRHPGQDAPQDEFLQLPPMSDRFRAKVAEVTSGAETTPEKVAAIEGWLAREFTYTTNLPDTGDNPVEGFMFEAKRGHCEYFATTGVLMLREAGVHARLVNGFLGGRWNPVGDFLAVRQGDAHSWVEYWDEDMGWWVPSDPTPASDMPQPNPVIQGLREAWDAGQLIWMKWVIEYDLSTQFEVFKELGRTFAPRGLMQDESSSSDAAESESFVDSRDLATWGGYFIFALLGFWGARRRRRKGRSPMNIFGYGIPWIAGGGAWIGWFFGYEIVPVSGGSFGVLASMALGFALAGAAQQRARHVARRAFDRVVRAARTLDVEPRADEGPSTFLDRVWEAAGKDARPNIARFKSIYLRARFSLDELSPADLSELDAAAKRAVAAIKAGA